MADRGTRTGDVEMCGEDRRAQLVSARDSYVDVEESKGPDYRAEPFGLRPFNSQWIAYSRARARVPAHFIITQLHAAAAA